jgi:hypothetical protein
MKKVWVIMPHGQGNTLAWSSQCWPSKLSAEMYLDDIADGDMAYRSKWWVQPLNMQPGEVIDDEQPNQIGTIIYTIIKK